MALLSTSGVIVILCILLGLYVVMGRRSKASSQVPFGAEIYAEDILEDAVLQAIQQQQTGEPPATSTEGAATVHAESTAPQPTVKRGRLALFGAGALALCSSLITAAVAAFTSLSWALPLVLLVLSIAALGLLRFWAVQDRNRRRARSALQVQQKRQHRNPATSATGRASEQASASAEIELRHRPQTSDRNRQQLPVNHAVKALRKARTQHVPHRVNLEPQPLLGSGETPQRLRMDAELPDRGWQPVSVPRPTYLDAEVAHTDLPEPVALGEAPRSQSETLAQAAGLNLDDVLRRRRA